MQVNLIDGLLQEPEKQRAEQVLNACVHCGFCTATCPTYLQGGNELDSPRGRIYLIKEMLEQGTASDATRTHLDRCVTCLSCETTCPSGVEYHKLVAIGRTTSERLAPRSPWQKALRWGLRNLLVTPGLFSGLINISRKFSALLPAAVKRVYFPPQAEKMALTNPVLTANTRPPALERGTVLIVRGCVQPSLRPQTDVALEKILQQCGVPVCISAAVSCCGAASFHTSGEAQARALARANIDAWWPLYEQQQADKAPLRAIVSTASGCGVHLKDYPHVLADDSEYLEKAQILAGLIRDPVELLESVFDGSTPEFLGKLRAQKLVFHCPCTLQHGQALPGRVEALLHKLGVQLPVVGNSHLCCGSAGTYSILQPTMSRRLREEKLQSLQASHPETILTGNIGCQLHLQAGTETPVRHWLEILADGLPPS
ncbi:glycolate oxidase subunit GlcF [Microbulbifer salipaludis]|uniref:Glycolate oxidase iron-sulfur subunit n=1 Tax=Microbulbifer salipaludis TaxID=187980 RepID=A0ABS3E9J3_9GAMM|nr:glycolate oxidase subunit GlcF [Microbulbifer salipaludis]MBN8431980.1 glycolate oxidase subunit GlcF [Microbulbifer salipaludis]